MAVLVHGDDCLGESGPDGVDAVEVLVGPMKPGEQVQLCQPHLLRDRCDGVPGPAGASGVDGNNHYPPIEPDLPLRAGPVGVHVGVGWPELVVGVAQPGGDPVGGDGDGELSPAGDHVLVVVSRHGRHGELLI